MVDDASALKLAVAVLAFVAILHPTTPASMFFSRLCAFLARAVQLATIGTFFVPRGPSDGSILSAFAFPIPIPFPFPFPRLGLSLVALAVPLPPV